MPKTKSNTLKRPSASNTQNFDGVFLFKMVLYLLLGSMWLKVGSGTDITIPIPAGLAIGLLFTTHEHFQIDRKLEYIVMIMAMLFGFFAPYGLYINV